MLTIREIPISLGMFQTYSIPKGAEIIGVGVDATEILDHPSILYLYDATIVGEQETRNFGAFFPEYIFPPGPTIKPIGVVTLPGYRPISIVEAIFEGG